jgi:hypothetical protein
VRPAVIILCSFEISAVPHSNTMNCMSEAFRRLCWSVLEDISTILVAPTSEDPGAAWLPFLGHPIAAEPASETPLRAIGFTCEVLNNYDCLDDNDEWYEAPDAWIVRREDGGIVTVGDVVEQLPPHLFAHKKEILEFVAPMLNITPGDLPEDTRIFFHGFTGAISASDYDVEFSLWAEGENRMSANKKIV